MPDYQNPFQALIELSQEPPVPVPESHATNEALLKDQYAWYEQVIVGSKDDSLPCLMVVLENGNICPIMAAFDGEDTKELFCQAMKKLFPMIGVARYAFTCEAWVRQMQPGDEKDGVMPRDHPQRIEVLSILVKDNLGEVIGQAYEIERNEATGVATALTPRFASDPGTKVGFAGRFAELL